MNLLYSGTLLETWYCLLSLMAYLSMAIKQTLTGSYARSGNGLNAKMKNIYDLDKIWTTWA